MTPKADPNKPKKRARTASPKIFPSPATKSAKKSVVPSLTPTNPLAAFDALEEEGLTLPGGGTQEVPINEVGGADHAETEDDGGETGVANPDIADDDVEKTGEGDEVEENAEETEVAEEAEAAEHPETGE